MSLNEVYNGERKASRDTHMMSLSESLLLSEPLWAGLVTKL